MTKSKRKAPQRPPASNHSSAGSPTIVPLALDLPVEEDDSLLPIEVEAVELARTASASSSTDKGSSSKPRSRSSASSKPQSIAPTAPPNPVASSSRAPLSAAAAGKLSRAATEKEKKEKKEREREEEEEQSRIKAEEMIKVEEEDGNKRSTRGRRKVQQPQEDLYKEFFAEDEEGEGEDGGEGVTRCVCGMDPEDQADALMIQCDTCKCWQHGPCVGLWGEKDCPDRYFCELCRPGWHGPGGLLRKAHRKANAASAPPPPSHRSPSVQSTHHSSTRNKPRESADAALVAAFLAAESSGSGIPERDPSDRGGDGDMARSPSVGVYPAPGGKVKAPSKRSTMNSRDAAYDDAIAMSLLGPGSAATRGRSDNARGEGESGMSGAGDESGDEGMPRSRRSRSQGSVGEDEKDTQDGHTAKRRRGSPSGDHKMDVPSSSSDLHLHEDGEGIEVDHDEAKEGEEKEEGEEEYDEDGHPTTASTAPTRAKHPNQYTYRPKNVASTRITRPSPAKRAPAITLVEQALRGQRPRDWTPLETGGWGLPEHLKHLAHLLPSPAPIPLLIPTLNTVPPPSSENEGMEGLGSNEPTFEPPTRVRFPSKRMTMPEMKKRARSVLDYVARIQIEMSERERRSESLAGGATTGSSKASGSSGNSTPAVVGDKDSVGESMRMMDSLTKDVILFQQRYFGSLE